MIPVILFLSFSDISGMNLVNISHTIEKSEEHDELGLQKHSNDSKTVRFN